ncbi:protein SOSEKI 3-like isoform X2 [Salvia miltiorrhiza]|uniref:protein SOSEKI 3-like isoform X2 n=1 Tax=Salvia miltiorrhiza TaxID=226208 RepID=UPI0025AB76F5|nr:protein SOSEKI 3-like isoform X2 [Salvia miltiorrhiza]
MDGRMKKYRQLSPDRAKVWTEKSPKYRYNQHYNSPPPPPPPPPPHHTGKVPVVYYLCRNRQLEHPHFMEVPLSSDDLYLRDVIERLNVLRGRGIGSLYSWSCKRSYKNGYVWHDLCDDDVIHPAHGNEYILKGSEIFEDSDPGRFSPAPTFMPCPQNQEESSSSSSLNGGTTKSSQDDELSPRLQPPCASAASPESGVGKISSWNGPLCLTEYKSEGIANASTQTDSQACAVIETGVSTDDGSLEPHQTQVSEDAERSGNSVLPPPSAAGAAASSGGGADTLESLIRADVRKMNSFRILEEEGYRFPSRTKLKIINMITQLISCGYVQEKDHSFVPRFSSSNFKSPFSTSLTLGEIDHLPENPRAMGKRAADKKCFSGSLAEKSLLEEVAPTLKRSSSYNADSTQHIDSINCKEEGSSTNSKCVPLSIKASLTKQLRCELLRSPKSERRRSSEIGESSRITDPDASSRSRRTTEPCSAENVIRIEESLLQELEL